MKPWHMMRRFGQVAGAAGGDPYWGNVVSLLHFDGADGSTTFTDQTGIVWTLGGNAQIDTAQSKFGGSSGRFDGSGDYLFVSSTPRFGFGTGDFTIECWIRSTATDRVVFDNRDSESYGVFIANHSLKGNGIAFYSVATGLIGGSTASNDGNWHHYAWTRAAGMFRMFQDGVKVYEGSVAGDFGSSRPGWIGVQYGGRVYGYNGWIDELRITKGVARYTANFTPPSAPFPDS